VSGDERRGAEARGPDSAKGVSVSRKKGGEKMAWGKTHFCSSCKKGENEEPATCKVIVRDPGNGKITLKGYLCDDHYTMYADDGYQIKVIETLS